MRHLFVFSLCLLLITGCKKEISTSNTDSNSVTQTSYLEYTPNPDEVIMEVELVNSELSDDQWKSEARVIRQHKSGHGFKDKLAPGSIVILLSREKISLQKFYCSAEYQLSENNQNPKTFVLREYLTQ